MAVWVTSLPVMSLVVQVVSLVVQVMSLVVQVMSLVVQILQPLQASVSNKQRVSRYVDSRDALFFLAS